MFCFYLTCSMLLRAFLRSMCIWNNNLLCLLHICYIWLFKCAITVFPSGLPAGKSGISRGSFMQLLAKNINLFELLAFIRCFFLIFRLYVKQKKYIYSC